MALFNYVFEKPKIMDKQIDSNLMLDLGEGGRLRHKRILISES